MIRATAVLLAAGKGVRLHSKVPKPMVKLAGKPIIAYSLAALNAHGGIRDIVVACNPGNKKAIEAVIKKYRIGKVSCVVYGGRRRQDSVRAALRVLDPRSELVLIHDAARPFIGRELISALINTAARRGAAIPGVALKPTVKVVDAKRRVQRTLDRGVICEIQTPQVFRKSLILEAYKRFGRSNVTDDAALVEKMRKEVSVVTGSYSNIKITTPEDMVLARAIAEKR